MRLHVGGGTSRGALTVFPIWGEYAGARGYTSDPAGLELAERDDGPAVPVLVARNSGALPVLLLEGQVLEGGWQNRVLTRSCLVAANSALDLEVACVEAGRWAGGGRHSANGRRCSVRIRTALSRGDDRQAAVWQRVGEYDARYGPDVTSSLVGHLDRASQHVDRLVGDLGPLPGQSGLVVAIAGQPVMAEVFDSPTTLRHEFASIIAAAGMDALGAEPVATPSRRARRFVNRATGLGCLDAAPAGLGTTVRGRSEDVEVSGLAWRGRVVHATFTNVRHPLYAGAAG